MANTFDADLVMDKAADRAILVLQKKLPAFRAFSRDFGIDTLNPRATVQVEKSGTAATGTQNPTTYVGTDSTNSNVAVTVNEENVSFYLTNQESMQGHKLETKIDNHLNQLAKQIWAIPEALLAEGTFTNTVVVATEAAIDADDLALGWGTIAEGMERHCVLSGPAYSRFNAQNKDAFNHESGAYNFDGFHLCTQWSNATEANTRGFFSTPNAMAVAAGLPDLPGSVAADYIANQVIEVPGLGLSVLNCLWTDKNTRKIHMSFGVMFGAAVGDITALTLYQTS